MLPPLILASASPRRGALLTQIGIPHRVIPAHIDESRHPDEEPIAYVRRLAFEKAQAVHAQHPKAFVLAADTTVVLAGTVLNKPVDRAAAEAMLRSLAGATHHVHTGLALLGPGSDGGLELGHVETTAVSMTPIPETELLAYLDSGDSLDKAGGYGIQGYAARWVARIEGDYSNVVGLPLAAAVQLLRRAEAETGV